MDENLAHRCFLHIFDGLQFGTKREQNVEKREEGRKRMNLDFSQLVNG